MIRRMLTLVVPFLFLGVSAHADTLSYTCFLLEPGCPGFSASPGAAAFDSGVPMGIGTLDFITPAPTSFFFTTPTGWINTYGNPGGSLNLVDSLNHPIIQAMFLGGGSSHAVAGGLVQDLFVPLSFTFIDPRYFSGLCAVDCEAALRIVYEATPPPSLLPYQTAAITGLPPRVPEPSTLLLVASGLSSLGLLRRWRSRRPRPA